MWRRFSSIDAPVLKKAGIVALSIILICVGLGLFFFGRRQVQEIIGIAILIGILSSLVSSGIFNTFLSNNSVINYYTCTENNNCDFNNLSPKMSSG